MFTDHLVAGDIVLGERRTASFKDISISSAIQRSLNANGMEYSF